VLPHYRRDVVKREHGTHPGQRLGGAGIERFDQRVRVLAAHEGGMQHARQLDIVDIAPLAHQQAAVLDAQHGPTDFHRHDQAPPPARRDAAAASAALTMP
jgi:hypothetical protein